MKTIKTLCTLLCVMLLTALSATAQNADDNKNKAIIEANDGNHELNTDDIQVIRFDGGKITVVQPWGETTFDRTLRSLSFQRPNPGMLRLTVNTTIGTENGSNRAQEIDGDGKLKSTWASGDVVYVYADDNPDNASPIGTLTPKSYGEKSTILQGNINFEGIADGEKTLYFSTKDRSTLNLSSQDGTVESLFYFTAQANVTVDGGNASLSGTLTFTRPIAVVKFMLKDKGNGDAEISTKSFTVHDGTNTYTVTPATPTDELFVGIPGISNKTVTLTATDGNEYYLYQRNGVSFTNNNYYAINVKMEASDLARPLTFEAKTAGATVTFNTGDFSPAPTIEYSTDGITWATYSSPITLAAAGDRVLFRGTNPRYAMYPNAQYCKFECSADCYAIGNIMSLINKESFVIKTTLTENCSFSSLFLNNTHLLSHPSMSLVLPATTLTSSCYKNMFKGCTGLTIAPELPATTLTSNCYENMFQGCTSLTTAPTLPAETLEDYCYQSMFEGCTNLTTAPALPATTVTYRCYYYMFYNCTSLTTAPALPATTLFQECYASMFYGCTHLITPPDLPATALRESCYHSMFRGCTSLTTAPVLPAQTLALYCYANMFRGCTSLNSVTCLATNISASLCTQDWLKGVAATGTFIKPTSMTSWTTGVNGIPSGWTTALPGQFTINSGGGKVYFSQGNLQYQASTGTWRFAEHQYENIGASNANISESYTGWIDLFGWGTSGYNHGAVCYQPWSASTNNTDYHPYGSVTANLYDGDGTADWGYNAISNGGNSENSGWRTPKKDEWVYLFNTRTTTSGIRYAKATVNGVTGVILFPDDWDTSYYALNNTNTANAGWSSNTITASDWAASLEAHGAVFLPTSGNRDGANSPSSGFVSCWSSNYKEGEPNNALVVYIPGDGVYPDAQGQRSTGNPVRLVRDTELAGSISYATSEVNKTTADAAFTNELTKVGDGTVSYAVSSGDDICTVNASTGLVTLNGTAGTCTITATVTNGFYTYTTKTASYTLTVTAATMAQTPLTLEAKMAGTIAITNPKDGMQYSLNGGAKTQVPTSITVAVGDIVRFYGNGTEITCYGNRNTENITSITGGTADCYIYGNIMSLVDETGFATATAMNVTEYFTFRSLFSGNSHLVNHPDKSLLLPATTLAENCYQEMFYNCTGLTHAPALPATTLADDCYRFMFQGCTNLSTAPVLPATTVGARCYRGMFYQCTSLTTAPALPATALSQSCYMQMFYGCTSLTTAPALPATTLANYCYQSMFSHCTNLMTAPALPATTMTFQCYMEMFSECTSLTAAPALSAETLANSCYGEMFYGCTGLTTAPELPATTLANYCYYEMFKGCTGLTTAPELPATSLVNNCYYEMFRGCSSLSSITCLATSGINENNSTTNWLNGVAATGTFTKAASASWPADASGIPSGWTVENAPEPFSVSSTKQVYFSKGNLQYQASTSTWRFAEHQWDFVGDATNGNVYVGAVKSNNALIASDYSGWIDLFGWGTSGYNHGANCYQPYSTSQEYTDYYAYGSYTYNLYNQTGRADWGYTASAANLSGRSDWYTLKVNEWGYVFNTRSTTSGVRYAKATVNGVAGVILLPDNWNTSYHSLTSTNTASANYTTNIISSSDWTNDFEAHGAVFLPAAGRRYGTTLYDVGARGDYWSSSYISNNNSYYVYFISSSLNPQDNNGRFNGYSVRLVRNAN